MNQQIPINADIEGILEWTNGVYRHFHEGNLNETMHAMVMHRYKIPVPGMPHQQEKVTLLVTLVTEKFIRDLTDLTVWILKVETGYYTYPEQYQNHWKDVITGGLLTWNIPEVDVIAEHVKRPDFSQEQYKHFEKLASYARYGDGKGDRKNSNKRETTVEDLASLKSFISKLPISGYHAFEGRIDAFDSKGLSFSCGCGSRHSVLEANAIIDFGLVNKAVYLCPSKPIFTLVGVKGMFRIKGLKTISTFVSPSEDWKNAMLAKLEERKKVDT